MHPRQKIALADPCTFADGSLASRFLSVEDKQGLLLATVLTVNK